MDSAMYDQALRRKIRFQSPKGMLSLEQLWDVPLRGHGEFNLDTIAKEANRTLRMMSEESFVAARKTTEIIAGLLPRVETVEIAEAGQATAQDGATLFKIKTCEKINHPSTICRTYGAGRHIIDIPRINFRA